jgi:hypothetical protein
MKATASWLLALALCWHALAVGADAWPEVAGQAGARGRDFASYYYAAAVASEGGDPYDKAALGEAARADRTRATVHPFFYPPPFLFLVAWAPGLPLHEAAAVWFWIDEAALVVAALALMALSLPLGTATPLAIAALVAAMTAVPNNHVMGQANLPPLAAAALGLVAARRGQDTVAGLLVGAACMWKMSPALLVGWWALHRRWRAVGGAVVAAVVGTVAVLPWVGPAEQVRFYTVVLPGFASGDYNGLTVPIGLFGNHSLPNLADQLLPSDGSGLGRGARVLSAVVGIGVLAVTARAVRDRPSDARQEGAQLGAICAAMLLLPVYTYEHHLVWAIPSAGALVAGVDRLGPTGRTLAGASIALLCFDLTQLKAASEASPWLPWAGVLQEAKTAALLSSWWLCTRLARGA